MRLDLVELAGTSAPSEDAQDRCGETDRSERQERDPPARHRSLHRRISRLSVGARDAVSSCLVVRFARIGLAAIIVAACSAPQVTPVAPRRSTPELARFMRETMNV